MPNATASGTKMCGGHVPYGLVVVLPAANAVAGDACQLSPRQDLNPHVIRAFCTLVSVLNYVLECIY